MSYVHASLDDNLNRFPEEVNIFIDKDGQETQSTSYSFKRGQSIFFNVYKTDSGDRDVIGEYTITCRLDDEEYLYGVEFNKNYQAINIGGDAFISNHVDLIKYDDANQIIAHIEDYFNEHDGTCETVETRK